MSYNKEIHDPYVKNPSYYPNYELNYAHRHYKQDQIYSRTPFLYKSKPGRTELESLHGYNNPYSIGPSDSFKNDVARGRDPHKVMDNSKFSEKVNTHPMIHSLGHKQTFRPVSDEVTNSHYFRTEDHHSRMLYQRYKDYNINYELEDEYELTRPKKETQHDFEQGSKTYKKCQTYNYPYTFAYHQDPNNQEVRHPSFYSSDNRYFPYRKNFLDDTKTVYKGKISDHKSLYKV